MEPDKLRILNPLPTPIELAPSPKILNTLEMKKDAVSSFSKRTSSDDYNIADLRGVKDLLINLHKSAKLNSEMHFGCIDHFTNLNTKVNISLLIMSVLGSITGPIVEAHSSVEVHTTFNSIILAIVGGWGLVINKLNYQTQVEQHRQAKESYDEIVDLIEMAIAYANETDLYHTYDFTHVLNEVQHIRQNLNKFTPPIPSNILGKFISFH